MLATTVEVAMSIRVSVPVDRPMTHADPKPIAGRASEELGVAIRAFTVPSEPILRTSPSAFAQRSLPSDMA